MNNWTHVEKKYKNINFEGNVFIPINAEKSNKYNKVLQINPDLEKQSFLDLLKNNYYFKSIENSKNYGSYSLKEQKILYKELEDKNISIEHIYKIYFKSEITSNIESFIFKDNHINSFIISNNRKLLNIIIYEFENNIYGILSYYDPNKKRLLLVNTYIELLMYIYKIEMDLKLNPYYTKIFNSYPRFFKNIPYQNLIIYFNNFSILWK